MSEEKVDEEQVELDAASHALAAWARIGVDAAVESLRQRTPGFGLLHLSLNEVKAIAEEAAAASAMGLVVALRMQGIRLTIPKPDGT